MTITAPKMYQGGFTKLESIGIPLIASTFGIGCGLVVNAKILKGEGIQAVLNTMASITFGLILMAIGVILWLNSRRIHKSMNAIQTWLLADYELKLTNYQVLILMDDKPVITRFRNEEQTILLKDEVDRAAKLCILKEATV